MNRTENGILERFFKEGVRPETEKSFVSFAARRSSRLMDFMWESIAARCDLRRFSLTLAQRIHTMLKFAFKSPVHAAYRTRCEKESRPSTIGIGVGPGRFGRGTFDYERTYWRT